MYDVCISDNLGSYHATDIKIYSKFIVENTVGF